jgi:hypothetical protein
MHIMERDGEWKQIEADRENGLAGRRALMAALLSLEDPSTATSLKP